MHFTKASAIAALFILSIINAAHADVEVVTNVDNQTSPSVSLTDLSTDGTFSGAGPVGSVPANTKLTAALTFTVGISESGHLTYGPCTISWDVYIIGFTIDVNTFSSGTGCTANILAKIPRGSNNALVLLELDIK